MFCTHCGKELPDDARFCTGCGNAVTPANTPQQSSAPAEAKTPAPCKKVYEEQQETGGTGKTIWNLLMLLTKPMGIFVVNMQLWGSCRPGMPGPYGAAT